jgi:Spy/CpxP family protein refolding chaperone
MADTRRNQRAAEKQYMKRTFLITTISILGLSLAQAHPKGERHGGWHRNPLEEMSETLNLTDAQKAKIQPIIDQAKPQIRAIHQEAIERTHTVVQNSIAQIRPQLTPEQQAKLDGIVKAHENMHNAMKELHDAKGE